MLTFVDLLNVIFVFVRHVASNSPYLQERGPESTTASVELAVGSLPILFPGYRDVTVRDVDLYAVVEQFVWLAGWVGMLLRRSGPEGGGVMSQFGERK